MKTPPYTTRNLLPNEHFVRGTEIASRERVEVETTRYLLAELVATIQYAAWLLLL